MLYTWRMWSCLQCIRHNPPNSTKPPRCCHNSKCCGYFTGAAEQGALLGAAKKANSLAELLPMKADHGKSVLKVTLVPGSAHPGTPLAPMQKGSCACEPESATLPAASCSAAQSTALLALPRSCQLPEHIPNSIPSPWCRSAAKKMHTALLHTAL